MHIVITGANRGIGLALTKVCLAAGHQVTGLCRHTSPALAQSGATVIEGVDVAGDLAGLAGKINAPIDVLINNAGLLVSDQLGQLPWADIARQFEINSVGPLKVTEALLPLLNKGSTVALITSRMGSMADNGSGAYYGYRMSKAALNAAGKSLALDLAPRGISVAILHPGFVQTDMVGGAGDISADQAASRLMARIAEANLANSGSFRHSNGDSLPW